MMRTKLVPVKKEEVPEMKKQTNPGKPPHKKISTSSAKAKGRSLQQWTCQKISELLDIPWGKDELIASREASQTGTDIRLVGEAKKKFPYSVECKWQESWSLSSWIEQAKSNQGKEMDWLLIIKKSRMTPLVVMDADRFFELLKKRG
jgi:hypothetical protein